MNSNLTPGSRVRDRIWGGTENGTVTGVDADGTVTIQWDSAQFTEDQRDTSQVEPIDGTSDPTPRYAVAYGRWGGHDADHTGPAPSAQDDEDTDSM